MYDVRSKCLDMAVRCDIATIWILSLLAFIAHDFSCYCLNIGDSWPLVRSVSAESSNTNSTKSVINIAAVLDCDMACQQRFRSILETPVVVNAGNNGSVTPPPEVEYNVILVTSREQTASEKLISACDVISEHNITLFVAVASQDAINLESIITRGCAIPLIAYTTSSEKHSFKVHVITYATSLTVIYLCARTPAMTNDITLRAKTDTF